MLFRQPLHVELSKADHKARDPELRTHIKELRQNTFQQMFVLPQSAQTLGWRGDFFVSIFFHDLGEVGKEDEYSYGKKEARDHQIRQLHRAGLRGLVSLQLGRTHRSNCVREYSTPDRMKAAPMTGVMTAPTELNDCARFRRRSELSGGPKMVT